ncbi:TIGR03862 family flavoprotein [Rhizobiales bacterium RZME27]|uniref:TIGR03862 family flavoprotein n=1 Tax=Endobacterium cereale TaxID=2663029 RepID=A0A6A8ADY6_9HYPH|nr:TIGR03862 family flavoprotein [Endobacterium cereale]MEB2848271.1 TIGR03862 family flavoprotein [Endobacterium cereale]MQY48128.1 TIGR03862 family flavoprotein [Endobacterium cereale]
MTAVSKARRKIAIIGGGPAGLMAAEYLSAQNRDVTVYEAMPTVARKFLLAGKSGLNLTHSEEFSRFSERYGDANDWLRPSLDTFTPDNVREWAAGLGTETFIGSSGRVFPVAMKASPLLRGWVARLRAQGVAILTRHRWTGFDADRLILDTPEGTKAIEADAVLLALGGASWPRLGSDAAWLPWLRDRGVETTDFLPANCGFDVAWSEHFRERNAGAPIKSVVASVTSDDSLPGEFVISRHGIEGSLVYAHASTLRARLMQTGTSALVLDLMPGRARERLTRDLARQDRKASLSNRLRKGAGIDGVKTALLRELCTPDVLADPASLAARIKGLEIPLVAPRPIAEAISSAGGIRHDAVDENFMLRKLPGLFAAGEMLDWEAPTGGYLLTACLATGKAAARGIEAWLAR